MQYRYTLLKDLPEYPKGTVFTVYGTVDYYGCTKGPFYEVGIQDEIYPDLMNLLYFEVGGFFDDPTWFRKELDANALTDMTCPKCGSTNGFLFHESYHQSDEDRDDYGTQFAVGIECTCGHKRVLYGTKHGIKYLKSKHHKIK